MDVSITVSDELTFEFIIGKKVHFVTLVDDYFIVMQDSYFLLGDTYSYPKVEILSIYDIGNALTFELGVSGDFTRDFINLLSELDFELVEVEGLPGNEFIKYITTAEMLAFDLNCAGEVNIPFHYLLVCKDDENEFQLGVSADVIITGGATTGGVYATDIVLLGPNLDIINMRGR